MSKAKVFYEVTCMIHGTQEQGSKRKSVKVGVPRHKGDRYGIGCPHCKRESKQ